MRATRKAPHKLMLAMIVAVVLAMGLTPIGAWAAPAETALATDSGLQTQAAADPIDVCVTVSNKGTLALARQSVTVADADGNGSITLDEALAAAHEKYCPAGKDGYATRIGEWGFQVTRLWGVDTTVNSFYKNDVMTDSVDLETVAAGDEIVASVMADADGWSDCFGYFDKKEISVAAGEEFELALKADSWGTSVDASGVQVGTWADGAFAPIEGKTTGEGGKVALSFAGPGTYVVSANGSVAQNAYGQKNCPLTAPVCIVSVAKPTPVPAKSATRYAGNKALDTMALIVQAGFADGSCDAVVVASLDAYWDALAASSLAGKVGCPVLMTDPNSLSAQTATEIARLGAKKAYIAGGSAAVSDDVEAQLEANGLSVERVWGADAQVTAIKTAQALGTDHAETCVVATSGGYWDALSASPYAYVAKAPVFLTDFDGVLRADTLAAIEAGGYTSAVIAGGTAAVDESAEAALKGAGVSDVKRCGGDDAYETAVLLAKWEMDQGMGVSHIGVATSANGYWDALSGAALCGVNNSVIMLADGGAIYAVDQLIAPNAAQIEAVNVFGGPEAVDESVDDAIAKALAGNVKVASQAAEQATNLVAAALAA